MAKSKWQMANVGEPDVLRTPWGLEFDEDFFVVVRPGDGDEGLMVYAPKNERDRERVARLIAGAPRLLKAAETILRDLNARIDVAAKGNKPVPVYRGIADLCGAIRECGGRAE